MMRTWALVIATLGVAGATAGVGVASITPPARCTSGQLKVTRSSVLAATGHRSIVLTFKNKGVACILRGYPGVDALSSKLKRVASAKRTLAGFMGGFRHGKKPPLVRLGAGQTASAVLEWVPLGGRCVRARYLLVTPPNTTRSVRFAPPHLNAEDICHLQIHPVVKGRSGQG